MNPIVDEELRVLNQPYLKAEDQSELADGCETYASGEKTKF